jgi:hypothetical protein
MGLVSMKHDTSHQREIKPDLYSIYYYWKYCMEE